MPGCEINLVSSTTVDVRTDPNGDVSFHTVGGTAGCNSSVTVGNRQFTFASFGEAIHFGCTIVPLSRYPNELGEDEWHPEYGYPASQFPVGLMQRFTGGYPAIQSMWAVGQTTDGLNQWVQVW